MTSTTSLIRVRFKCTIIDRLKEETPVPSPYTPALRQKIQHYLTALDFESLFDAAPAVQCRAIGKAPKEAWIPVRWMHPWTTVAPDGSWLELWWSVPLKKAGAILDTSKIWHLIQKPLENGWLETQVTFEGFGDPVRYDDNLDRYVRGARTKSATEKDVERRYMPRLRVERVHVQILQPVEKPTR